MQGQIRAARAQDLNDVLRGSAAIILELNRQQQIENRRRQQAEENQRRRAQESQRQAQPTATAPRANRAMVAQIQSQLTELGYDPGPIDGAMGPRTRRAIIAFQRDKGLAQTGAANEATAAAVQTAFALAARAPSPSTGSAAGGVPVVSGPSFDCARAATPPERVICADLRLGALDRELARLYGDANAAVGDAWADALRADQREWLTRRDACGADPSCINARMEERIAALAAMAGGSVPSVQGNRTSSAASPATGTSVAPSDARIGPRAAIANDYRNAVALAVRNHAQAYLDRGPVAAIDYKLATADAAGCASLAREIEAMAGDVFLARATLDRWMQEFQSALSGASGAPARVTYVLRSKSFLGSYDFAASGFPINNAPFMGGGSTKMRLEGRDAVAPPCGEAGGYSIGRILQAMGETGTRQHRTDLAYLQASVEPVDAPAVLPMDPAEAQALVERFRAISASPSVDIELGLELSDPVNPFTALPAKVVSLRIHDGLTGALLHEVPLEQVAPPEGVSQGTIRDYALIAFRSDLDAYRRSPELNGLVLEAASNNAEICRRVRDVVQSNDQFAIRDYLAEAAARFEAALPEIEAASGPFEREFVIERNMPLGDYDPVRKAFTFNWPSWVQGVVEPGVFPLADDLVNGCKVNILGIGARAARYMSQQSGSGATGIWLNLDSLQVRHDGARWAAVLPIPEDEARAMMAAGVRSVTVVPRLRFGPRETQGPGPLPGEIVSVEFRNAMTGETLGVIRRPEETPADVAAREADDGVQVLTPELLTDLLLPLITRIDDDARVFRALEASIDNAQRGISGGLTPPDLPIPLADIRGQAPEVVVARHRDAILAALGAERVRLPRQVTLRSATSVYYTAHDAKLRVLYGHPVSWQPSRTMDGDRFLVPARLDFGARNRGANRPASFRALVANELLQTALSVDKSLREELLDLPVEEAVRRGFGTDRRAEDVEADVVLDVGDVRLEGGSVAIIEADIVRVVLRWKSDGAVLAELDFASRLTPAEEAAASLPPSASELPISPPPPGAPMTAEIADLLQVRFLPESLDDRHYTRMLLSRHAYEYSLSRRGQEPEWGAFFVAPEGSIDAADIEARMPEFRAWTEARAAAAPTRVTVALSLNSGTPSYMRWGDFDGQLDLLCRNIGMRYESGTEKAEAGAKLCAFLRAAWAVPDDHLFLKTDTFREHAGGSFEARGPRGRCGGDSYCRNMADAMQFAGVAATDERGLFVPPIDLIRIDRVPQVDPSRFRGQSGASLAIELEITGVEQLETWPDTAWQAAVRAAAPFAANAGIDREFGGLFGGSGRTLSAPPGAMRWTANVLSAQVLNGDGSVIEDVALAAPAPLPVDELEMAETRPAGSWDVLGLALGMAFSEAEAAVRERLPSGEVLTADRAKQTKAIAGMPEPYSSGKLFVSEDESELIAIFNEPPADPDRVVALWRMLRLPAGTIDVATLRAQLEAKYGAPVDRMPNGDDRVSFVWSDFKPENGCLDVSMTHQAGIWAFEDSSAERGAYVEKRYFPGPKSYPLSSLAEYVAKNEEAAVSRMESDLRGECGPGLTVEVRTRPTAKPEDIGIEIIFVLQDPRTYGFAYLESLRKGSSTTTPTAAEEGTPKIDL